MKPMLNTANTLSQSERAMLRLSGVVAGTIGFLVAYWIWRHLLGVPLVLRPAVGGITLDGASSPVRPWAPWWVVPSFAAALGFGAWRLLAARGNRISYWGGITAILLTTVAIFPISCFALQLGAIAQYNPMPPVSRILTIIPLIALESLDFTAFALGWWHSAVLIPAALLGAALAWATRCALRVC